jgi:two-component system chemotaxis response regulator CheY
MKARLRILLVDDSPVGRQLVKYELRDGGYEQIEEAHSGRAAMARLRAEHFDVVISAWYMADGHGVDVLRFVRATPSLAQLPLVLLGSSLRQDLGAVALELGASAYLGKPFQAGTLVAVIDRLLSPTEPGG